MFPREFYTTHDDTSQRHQAFNILNHPITPVCATSGELARQLTALGISAEHYSPVRPWRARRNAINNTITVTWRKRD